MECPAGRLTYAELRDAADRTAAALHAAGVTPGALLPVLADDRREVIVAVLAALRVGAVFVPVDRTAPVLRRRRQLGELEPTWVAVGSGAGDEVPGASRIPIELIGDIVAPPEHEPGPDDPCYLFFTSGSTGRPKGIVGRLSGIDHYVRWETGLLDVRPGWRVSQLTSPAFDAFLRDVFVPLSSGGTVCVPADDVRTDPSALVSWLRTERIQLVHCVPSVFRGIAAAAETELPDLRVIAMAGERLGSAEVRNWFDTHGERVRLLNLYGPSETTMTKTFHFVTPVDADRETIPIGRPMPGARVMVLDERDQECPPGAVGELVVATPHRSLGYHGQPELTGEVFVPNPVTGEPADIVYRTGDFGRVSVAGDLEFLGRRDHQVKLGGVRVELGEVESALREHPAVQDAAVVVAGDSGDSRYLCAFVELRGEFDSDGIRRHLLARLAEPSVPSVFMPMAELPRTISGKVDRRALPASTAPKKRLGERVEPRTAVEKALVELWSELLPVDGLGVRHSFFDAGGHSLLVMRMLLRVRAEFGVEPRLRTFLANPVIEALAAQVVEALADRPLDDLFADELPAATSRPDGR